MYISLLLAYLGEAGLLAQCWPVIVLPLMTVYLNRIVIPLEEDILRKDFKEEFKNYCSRVNRWF
jgi:protein-S-isoprenylcysteine O-methyltransferase Ste14